ncbi:TPA: efflux RND transporter periplasmic adaptor subunit [Pseudomonas putida]|jgi:cobalt-zinc-cadmium efflux system membrane fusion protein|uniref:Efflux transporter, RND family, MFP subunit n=1 Tax=Pseudomonas putida (strain GB-1) TaxID=76869 RepID=B0KLG7_PSEPG|nr:MULTISPECIES: efflux RND transporter periplasmic adaptor subunit [Pseudomonas]ABY97944.1 efflux transporter, RND family, MFP subunit [Pseudomonas putida GB-1]APE98314.1 efflux transporter periplasmic adaptor subunit [Pseudomonas putida]MBP0709863.1 efflux RND transporter periplasmic adaptor subunit [Pseudomonas sp. T34]MCE1002801.1 efflux RND transporter periplasmic adaptor subunit [Pseudomonas sp. NMI1173_11]MCK2189310.1 efflux RND transporter periplasmic adaptor subunit [Pseudomonas sp. M
MTNPRKLALLAAAVAALGLGGLAWTGNLGQASKAEARHDDHGQDSHGHAAEQATEGHAEEGHAEEEGQLHLSIAQIEAAGVQLAAAGPRELGIAISFPGEIRFDEDRTAHVVPRVPGVVEAVHAELGQAVKRGQVLAVIASQQISDLRSEQQAAQRRLELARLTFQREQQLWQERISAEQDYLQARQALQEAEIALANARQKVAAVGPAGAGNRYELRAPFDAVVVEKHLTAGEVVDETSNAFTLSDLSRVWATFAVAPRDLGKVVTGRDVTVSAPDLGAQVEGKVNYVGSLLGEQNRAATVRATLANPNGAWRPGLFVNIAVSVERFKAAVTVPENALQTWEEQTVVFARTEEGFEARPVTTGRRDAGQVEILSGLAAGTQVAAAGSFVLKSELGKGSAEHSH